MSGVLLYYKYANLLGVQDEIKHFYEELCTPLGLVGRIRVAEDGVNVTVGGLLENLEKHIAAVKENNILKGSDIDFKLQTSFGAINEKTKEESKFDKLVIRLCEELVTLGPLAKCQAKLENTGIHLTPEQFHAKIFEAEETIKNGKESNMILLDTRNFYEARIGQFKASQIESIDPEIRCFSDFPSWVDANVPCLVNKTLMMYCTGGVRCERATAYVREKCEGFCEVYQLQGGIQRYLERFPSGGFFEGKNFVYDDRNAVGGEEAPPTAVFGRCQLCHCPWDDYSKRLRCSHCRQLLLVCSDCSKDAPVGSSLNSLLCEICLKNQVTENLKLDFPFDTCSSPSDITVVKHEPGKDSNMKSSVLDNDSNFISENSNIISQLPLNGVEQKPRKHRILCLHGFRQSAKKFEGRTCALRKKLKDLAEFVFVDGPHCLPLFYKWIDNRNVGDSKDVSSKAHEIPVSTYKRAWLVSLEDQQIMTEALRSGRGLPYPQLSSSVPNNSDGLEDSKFDAATLFTTPEALQDLPIVSQLNSSVCDIDNNYKQKLLMDWVAAPERINNNQFLKQIEGWMESLKALEEIFRTKGPFDGIMGFSQGAAIASVLCALRELEMRQCTKLAQPEQTSRTFQFNFAILASGFPSPVPEHKTLITSLCSGDGESKGNLGCLHTPSLHIFGNSGEDSQIQVDYSNRLAQYFDPNTRRIVCHQSAHIIPATANHIRSIRDFLMSQ